MNGYYITQDYPTKKIVLEPRDAISLYNMNIIELVLPKCKEVWCCRNLLRKLIIPEGCEYVNCRVIN
jgi:hypothetical protein